MSKRSMSLIDRARAVGLQGAAREHASLRTNLRHRIDIFGIMAQRGIQVMFQPLNPLYGAYLDEEVPGVLINVKHPPNLQRFTAAHEYGHFVMQHGTSADSEEQIFSSHSLNNVQEVEAQNFAAHFLMPAQLVNVLLQHMGLFSDPSRMTPREAYQLSLELGVSYEALVNHLVATKKVSQNIAAMLRRQTPKTIKASIGQGVRPQDIRADVWTFSEHDNERQVFTYLNDELHVYLAESPNDDNVWNIVDSSLARSITLLKSDLEISSLLEFSQSERSEFVRHFAFRVEAPGSFILRLSKQDNRSSHAPLSQQFELQLEVPLRPSQGLLEQQKELL